MNDLHFKQVSVSELRSGDTILVPTVGGFRTAVVKQVQGQNVYLQDAKTTLPSLVNCGRTDEGSAYRLAQ